MNTIEIKKILEASGIHPNKKLGQNFLCNEGIIRKITEHSDVNENDTILEIGPGLGVLTQALAEKAKHVTAVEIDAGLARLLSEKFKDSANLEIVHADFLNIHINKKFTKLISNLPYYCSSEIIFRIVNNYHIPDVYIMLQKEMAERIGAEPGSKLYGALTAALGLYYKPQTLFKIDRRSFFPSPEIDSCFIQLKRINDIELNDKEREIFHRFIKSAFWGRRKTIMKALIDSPHLDTDKFMIKKILAESGIDEKARGETLTVADFKNMARAASANCPDPGQ